MSDQKGFWKTTANTLGLDTQQEATDIGNLLDAQPDKNRIAVIGTMAAGKSSHIAGLVKAGERKASKSKDTEYPFKILVNEGSSNIYDDVAALRAGHFPPKTGTFKQMHVEPGLTLEWRQVKKILGQEITLWTRQIKVPICDFAGEDLVQLIDKVKYATGLGQVSTDRIKRLTNIVNNSAGYIITLKATRAQGLGKVIEKEPASIEGMSAYSDSNYARIIRSIIEHKRKNNSSPRIKGMAIVVTAWDGLAPVAEEIQQITGQPFNPLDINISQQSLEKFVYACFPSTHAAIVSLGIKNIRYFPSFFEVERDSNGNPICWEDEPNAPKIKRANLFDPDHPWEDNANTILDSEVWFFREIEWLQEFAALG